MARSENASRTRCRISAGVIGLAGLLATVTGITSCAADVGHNTGPAHVMKFALNSDAAGALAVKVPSKPKETVPTSTEDVDFELYRLKRSNGVVQVVFALHNTGDSSLNRAYVTEDLDENPAASVHVASGVFLVDTNGLKEYKTFREDGDDGACLCSETWNATAGNDFGPDVRRYYAAEVAAPPADVKTVTLRAGIATITNAKIEG